MYSAEKGRTIPCEFLANTYPAYGVYQIITTCIRDNVYKKRVFSFWASVRPNPDEYKFARIVQKNQ